MEQLWQVFHPAWAARLLATHDGAAAAQEQACTSILAQWQVTQDSRPDVAALLSGVPHFPRSDWPAVLSHPEFQGMFWQQSVHGDYVTAETSLAALWREEPTGA